MNDSNYCQFDLCGLPVIDGLGPRCRRLVELGYCLACEALRRVTGNELTNCENCDRKEIRK